MTVTTNYLAAYDSTTPSNIPLWAPAIMYYVGGRYAWSKDEIDMFPTPFKSSVTVFSSLDADWLDVESAERHGGDAGAADVRAWRDRQLARGGVAGVYCNGATLGAVRRSDPRPTLFWVAHPGGQVPYVPEPPDPGITVAGTQYRWAGPWDASLFDTKYFFNKEVVMPETAYQPNLPNNLTFVGSPAMASWSPGRLDITVVGSDHNMWHQWYVQGTGWSGWQLT